MKSSLAKRQEAKERGRRIKQATEVAMKYIDKNNSKALAAHLLNIHDDIKIDEMIDQDGFSLLHMAVFKNKGKSFDVIMKKARDVLYPNDLRAYVNMATSKDSFTALHYAAYRGNIHFCRTLQEVGAS
jgi:ankyrin repeat protein